MTFLDVGQGSAVIVRTASRVLAYDTGAQFSAAFSAADAVIIPYLRWHRIDTLDALVVSHSDNDHSGGCLLYTSPSPRDLSTSRMPSSA